MNRKIDYELFERILRLPQQKLKGMLESHLIRSGYRPVSERGFLYASGELPVLLVAHLDTVHQQTVRDIEAVLALSAKSRPISEIASSLGMEPSYVELILQCSQGAREDDAIAMAHLVLMSL